MIRFFTFFCLFSCCKFIFAQNCSVNAGIDGTYCLTDTVYLFGTKGGLFLSTIQWKQIAGASVSLNPINGLSPQMSGFSSGTYKFSISATCADGAKTSDIVSVTILNSTIANAGTDINTCPRSGTLAGNSPGAGETGKWTIVGANAGSVNINNNALYNSGYTANYSSGGVSRLRWTITNTNGCTTSDDVLVTNYGGNNTVNAGLNINLDGCYTSTTGTTLNGTFCGNGFGGQSGTWSVLNGPNMPFITFPNIYNTSVTGLIAGRYTFLYTVSGPCLNGIDSVIITVPPPLGLLSPILPNNLRLCDRPTSLVLTGSVPIYVNDTCRWVQISGPSTVVFNPSNSPSTTVTNLIAKGNNFYNFMYFMENAVTGCSNSANVTVTYIDTPFIIALNDRVLTCNQDSVFIPFIDSGGSSYLHSLLNGPYNGVLQRQINRSVNFYDMRSPGLYTFNISKQSGIGSGCVNANDEVNVIVSKTPSFSNAGSDQLLHCGTDSTEIAGNIPVTGFGKWSELLGPGTSVIEDSSKNVTKVSQLIAGKYKFRWLINGGQACAPKQDDMSVYISDSVPKYVNAGGDKTICYGGSIRLNGNQPDSNAFGAWRVFPDSGVVFSDTSIFNPFVSGLAKNKVYQFIWRIYNACGESFDTVQITTDSSLGPKASYAGLDRCLSDTTTRFYLDANTPWPGTGNWTKISGPSCAIQNDSVYNSLVLNITEGNYLFEWVISRGTCSANKDTVMVTVSKPASQAFAGRDIDTCSKNAIMNAKKPVVGSGKWYLNIGNGDGIINFPDSNNAIISGLSTGTYYYTWMVSNGACAKHSDDVILNIAEPPTTPLAEVGKVWCNPLSINIKANYIQKGKSYWSLNGINPNSPTFNSVDSANAFLTNFVSGIYHFKWNAVSSFGICPNQVSYRNDTIVVSAMAGNDKNLCNVYNAQLTGTIGSKGFWSKISGGSLVIDTTGSNTAIAKNMNSSGSPYKFLYAIDSSFGCPGGADSMEIVISDTARKANAGVDLSYCNRDTFFLNGNLVSPDTGTWSIYSGPPGGYISDIHLNSAYLLNPGIGNYLLKWTSKNIGCQNSDMVFIRNYDSSTAALAGNDTIICPPAIHLNATLSSIANASWRQLSGPNTAIISSYINPKAQISNLVQGDYQFEWRIDNGLCPATIDTVKIAIPYGSPSVSFAGNDTVLCNADSMGLSAMQPLVGSGKWTQLSGGNVFIQDDTLYNTKINALTAGLRKLIFSVSNGTCFSKDTVEIEVNAFPSVAIAGDDSQYCLYSNVNLTAVKPLIGIGKWTLLNGNGAIITNPDSAITSVNGLNAGKYRFLWTISNGICNDKTDSVNITIDSIPTLSNAGKDRITCLDTIKFSANKPVSGIGIWNFYSGRNNTTILNPNADTSSLLNLDSGTYVFIWQIAKGGCKSYDTMQIRLEDPQINDKCETPYNITDTGGVFYGDMCGAKTYGSEPDAYGYAACNTLFYRFRTPGIAIKPKVLNINVQSVNNCNHGLRFSLFDSAACPGLGAQHDSTLILNATGSVAFENLKSDQPYILVIDENRNPCAKTACNLTFNLFGTALPIELISFDVEKSGINQTKSQWEIVNDMEYVKYELWCESNGQKRLVQSVNNIYFSNAMHAYQVIDNEIFNYPATYSLHAINKQGIQIELAQKSIDDLENNSLFKIFPNPVSDQLKVETGYLKSKNIRIEVDDVSGRVIFSQSVTISSNNRYEIICKEWPNGIYNLRIYERDSIFNTKIVVIH